MKRVTKLPERVQRMKVAMEAWPIYNLIGPAAIGMSAVQSPRVTNKHRGRAIHELKCRRGSALIAARASRAQQEHKERSRKLAGSRTNLRGAFGEIPLG